jgi:hypothetical protein
MKVEREKQTILNSRCKGIARERIGVEKTTGSKSVYACLIKQSD